MRVVNSQLSYCLNLLAAMASNAHGMRLTDLAVKLEMPKSSTQRILDHLASEGWVVQDEETSHYRLTARLAVLGQRYLESAGIANVSQSLLDRLARDTGELARLTALDGRRLVWVGSSQGAPPGLRYAPSMGATIVLYATANGKAWLATLPEEEAVALALAEGLGREESWQALGPKAHRTKDALLADLAATRARGYAIADEEAERGVTALAVVVREPRDGPALGTASVAGPMVRVTGDKYGAILQSLQQAIADLALVWPRRRDTE